MIRKVLAAFIFSACAFVACAREATIYGKCNDTYDCRTEWNNIPGTECVDGFCKCVIPDYEHCCFGGSDDNCAVAEDYKCRPKEECDPSILADAGSDADTDAGDGG